MSQDLMSKESNNMIRSQEIDRQVATAHTYPRNIKSFLDEAIAMATYNEEVAESCIYSLPRKKRLDNGKYENTFIKGESVRLAEILFSAYRNMYVRTYIAKNDGKFITAIGQMWDLEKNIYYETEVSRALTNPTSDGIQQTGNAAQSIAFRNSIFKGIPKIYVKQVYQAAALVAVGDQKTLPKKRATVFERFQKMGIENNKIFEFFDKTTIEEFTLEDVENLIGIGTAIKEGALQIDSAFSVNEATLEMSANERVSKLLAGKGG
jgi:hypothetical protein